MQVVQNQNSLAKNDEHIEFKFVLKTVYCNVSFNFVLSALL